MNLNHERRGVFEQPQGGGEQTGPWGSTAPSHGLRGQDDPGRAEQGVSHDTIPWRGRGGGMPSHSGVEFERQLDKISIWLEGWNHTQVGLSQPPSLTSIGLIFSLQVLSQVFLHCDIDCFQRVVLSCWCFSIQVFVAASFVLLSSKLQCILSCSLSMNAQHTLNTVVFQNTYLFFYFFAVTDSYMWPSFLGLSKTKKGTCLSFIY